FVFADVKNCSLSESKPPIYQNYIHEDGKAILCMSNYLKDDDLYKFKSPNQIFWSDMLSVCCSCVASMHKYHFRDLETIWRIKV
ncbi:hypothetical protein QBC36DRAFT_172784, partial [Triangularia setosa]